MPFVVSDLIMRRKACCPFFDRVWNAVMTWTTYSCLLLQGHCHQVLPFVTVIALTQALLDWNYKI